MKKYIIFLLISVLLIILGVITDNFFGFLPQLDDYNIGSSWILYAISTPFCFLLISGVYSICLYIVKQKRPIYFSIIGYVLGFIIMQIFLSATYYWQFPNHFTTEGQKAGNLLGILAWEMNYIFSIVLGITGLLIDGMICLIRKNKIESNKIIFLISILLIVSGTITDNFFGFLSQLDNCNFDSFLLILNAISFPFCFLLISGIYSIYLYIVKNKRPIRFSIICYILGFVITQVLLLVINHWSFPNHITIVGLQKTNNLLGIFAWFLNYLLSIILGIFGLVIDIIINLFNNQRKKR